MIGQLFAFKYELLPHEVVVSRQNDKSWLCAFRSLLILRR